MEQFPLNKEKMNNKESNDCTVCFLCKNVNAEHMKPRFKRKLKVKFTDDICTQLCLKLCFFVILLSQDGFGNNCPETKSKKSLPTVSLKYNCPEVHCRTLDSYFQSNY